MRTAKQNAKSIFPILDMVDFLSARELTGNNVTITIYGEFIAQCQGYSQAYFFWARLAH